MHDDLPHALIKSLVLDVEYFFCRKVGFLLVKLLQLNILECQPFEFCQRDRLSVHNAYFPFHARTARITKHITRPVDEVRSDQKRNKRYPNQYDCYCRVLSNISYYCHFLVFLRVCKGKI